MAVKAQGEDNSPFSWIDSHEIAHPKKRAFLAAMSELGSITHACEAAKIGRRSHYVWIESDEAYVKAFEEAKERACDALEREARRRAIEGVDEPIIRNGFTVGTVKRYSDTLLIFLMKGAMPDKYKDRLQSSHTGPNGEPIQIIVHTGVPRRQEKLDSSS